MPTCHVTTNGRHHAHALQPDSDHLEVLEGATYCLGMGASAMRGIDIMKDHVHKMRGVSERASIIPQWLLPKASASLCLN